MRTDFLRTIADGKHETRDSRLPIVRLAPGIGNSSDSSSYGRTQPSGTPETYHQAGADPKVVLMIATAVRNPGQQVIRPDNPPCETSAEGPVESSARGKGNAIGRSSACSRERTTGMSSTE